MPQLPMPAVAGGLFATIVRGPAPWIRVLWTPSRYLETETTRYTNVQPPPAGWPAGEMAGWLIASMRPSGYGYTVSVLRRSRALEGTFVPGWSVRQVWLLSLLLCGAAFLIAWLSMRTVDLIGLLIVGPCCALLTGRWLRTAITAAVALVGALVLDVVGGSRASEHWIFSIAVGLVALVNTVTAAWLESFHARQARR